ncbi:MAG: hypothetical protein O2V44_08620, partial [Candidatus Bathyarchaeota archaeon]|nr:hypothetical protein [Candidatus Bathyarchaeota archaeon]
GYVQNPENLVGGANDGQYATLYAGPYPGDQAVIVGSMGYLGANYANGHIYLNGYSNPGYNSHLWVYVSYDNENWDLVSSQYVSPSGPHWIDCGVYPNVFRYIAIAVYDEGGSPSKLKVDSVLVIPPLPPPSQTHLTVEAYNQYGWPGYVPLWIDLKYVGTTGYTYHVTAGTHTIYVESPLYEPPYGYHVFEYYYYDGIINDDNPIGVAVTADKTVTAYYYSYLWW